MTSILGGNYNLDLSRLLIIGHSYGGGMSLYISSQAIMQGWGMNQLIMDLEAPWYSSTWPSMQADLSFLPNHTIVNVVGYQDDATAHPCIGMQIFERIQSRDHSVPLSSDQVSYLLIRSDRYGFPRMVATHYVCADALRDSLSNFGYFKRIEAMASFLIADNQEKSILANHAKLYFTAGNEEMLNMGLWTDGTPVLPLVYSTDPFGLRDGDEDQVLPYLLDSSHASCQLDS